MACIGVPCAMMLVMAPSWWRGVGGDPAELQDYLVLRPVRRWWRSGAERHLCAFRPFRPLLEAPYVDQRLAER